MEPFLPNENDRDLSPEEKMQEIKRLIGEMKDQGGDFPGITSSLAELLESLGASGEESAPAAPAPLPPTEAGSAAPAPPNAPPGQDKPSVIPILGQDQPVPVADVPDPAPNAPSGQDKPSVIPILGQDQPVPVADTSSTDQPTSEQTSSAESMIITPKERAYARLIGEMVALSLGKESQKPTAEDQEKVPLAAQKEAAKTEKEKEDGAKPVPVEDEKEEEKEPLNKMDALLQQLIGAKTKTSAALGAGQLLFHSATSPGAAGDVEQIRNQKKKEAAKAGQPYKEALGLKALDAVAQGGKTFRELASGNPNQTGANVSKLVGSLGAMIPVIGPVIKGFTSLVSGIFKVVDGLKKMSDQMLQYNFRFAEFSGYMTRVQALYEVEKIKLSMQKGQALSDSAGYLAEQKIQFEQQWQPIENAIDNASNYIVGGILEGFSDVIKAARRWIGLEEIEKPPVGIQMQGIYLNQIAEANWIEAYGRPPAFDREINRNFNMPTGQGINPIAAALLGRLAPLIQ